MSFDKIFDLTAGVYFIFYNIPGMAFCLIAGRSLAGDST